MEKLYAFFRLLSLSLCFVMITSVGLAQPEKPVSEMSREEMLEMSYEDLLNLSIEDFMLVANKFELSADELMEMFLNKDVKIASKTEESSFEAPLSTSVVTAAEIQQAGISSISEIFRLVPGMIVREKVNGVYDIHIRGNDNIPPGNFQHMSANSMTLVMIDNRVVYNFINGGMYWEVLPIGIEDIDRVEIIRGPSSALYGPNAVSGVINFITKKPEDNQLHANADVQYGNFNSLITSGGVSKGLGKFKLRLSGNYEIRDRFQDDYYSFATEQWTTADKVYSLFGYPYFDDKVPFDDFGMEKYGANAWLFYDINDSVGMSLNYAYQNSEITTAFFENLATPLSLRTAETHAVDFKAHGYGFTASVNYLMGEQALDKLMIKPLIHYDMQFLTANLEYNFTRNNLSIRPGLNYQYGKYDDLPYVEEKREKRPDEVINGLFNGENELNYFGLSLRVDYTLFEKLRLVAALRGDRYDYPDELYPSYQFIASYNINDKHLVRGVYSRANRGTFFGDVYTYFQNPLGPQGITPIPPTEVMPGVTVNEGYISQYYQYYVGNKELDLLTMDMFEIGVRNKLGDRIQTDFEFFYTITNDFNALKQQPQSQVYPGVVQTDTALYLDIVVHDSLVYENLDIVSKQIGATGAVKVYINEKLQGNLFATVQQTDLENHEVALDSLIDLEHKWTPSVYGGLGINYHPWTRLNINTNLYFFGDQTYTRYQSPRGEKNTDTIDAKVLWNAKVSFKFWQNNSVYVNVRNMLNAQSREFAFTDDSNILIMAGLHLNF